MSDTNSTEKTVLRMLDLMERMLEMQDKLVQQVERVTLQVEELQERMNERDGVGEVKLNRLN